MKISREGVLLIKSFEGFRPRAMQRDDGRWSVGYGHMASAHEGARVSEGEAELLLQYDLIPVQAALAEGLTRPVNPHQYDALASFAFSVGVEAFRASDVLARVNSGAESDAADAIFAWPEPPVRDTGLRRRAAERALFNADPASAVTLSDLLVAPVSPAEAEAPKVEAADEVPIFAPDAPPPRGGDEGLAETSSGPDALTISTDAAQADSVLASATPADPARASDFSPPSGVARTAASTDIAQGELIAPVAASTLDEAAAQGVLETSTSLPEGAGLSAPRLVWPEGQPADISYEDQGHLDLTNSPVSLAEPFDARPEGFSWRRLWAYLVMGGFGLVSLAMAMAALRKASLATSDVTSILAIAAVLAIIGAVCVGVSAYNIYQRLSDDD